MDSTSFFGGVFFSLPGPLFSVSKFITSQQDGLSLVAESIVNPSSKDLVGIKGFLVLELEGSLRGPRNRIPRHITLNWIR